MKAQAVLAHVTGCASLMLAMIVPAYACDPAAIQLIGIAPARVAVPVGGNAKVAALVICMTDANDFPGGGNQANYKIRLMDEDPTADDRMGTGSDQFNRVAGQGAVFRRRVRLQYTLSCPAQNPTVQGDEDSGEGQPGGGDPADLVLEIDNGATARSDNYYAANIVGNPGAKLTVPAECVLALGDEDQVSSAVDVRRNQLTAVAAAFLAAGEVLLGVPAVPQAIAVGDFSPEELGAYRAQVASVLEQTAAQLGSVGFSTRLLGVDFSPSLIASAEELLVAGAALRLADTELAGETAALSEELARLASRSGSLALQQRTEFGAAVLDASGELGKASVALIAASQAFTEGAETIGPALIELRARLLAAAAALQAAGQELAEGGFAPQAVRLPADGTAVEARLFAEDTLELVGQEGAHYSCVVHGAIGQQGALASPPLEVLSPVEGVQLWSGDGLGLSFRATADGAIRLAPQREHTASRVVARCCYIEGRGSFNFSSAPFNFLELINRSGSMALSVQVRLAISDGSAAPVTVSAVVPAGGRVDLGLHDLAPKGATRFGTVSVTHGGPAAALDGYVSYYGEGLILRESSELRFGSCSL